MKSRAPEPVDDLTTGALPARVQTAHERLAHQDDPALTAALSERELAENRAVAERLRDHDRLTTIAAVDSAESAAEQIRRAQSAILRADVDDLVLAREALAAQRRESSPHAQLAHLYRIKKWAGRGFAGVVVSGMLWSAVNVQHNIAPGGPGEPLYWASYALEALISTVLIIFMVATSAVSRWRVEEGTSLIRSTEVVLLITTIMLNTYPYVEHGAWFDAGVHGIAPVMIGVALLGHDAVSRLLGAAIARASAAIPEGDDIGVRLADLTRVTLDPTPGSSPAVRPARATEVPTADPAIARGIERALIERRVLRERRASSVERGDSVERRASSAPDPSVAPSAGDATPIGEEATSSSVASAPGGDPAEQAAVHSAEHALPTSSVEHTPADLDAEHVSSVEREPETAPATLEETPELEHARRTAIALVRTVDAPRSTLDSVERARRAGRASSVRESAVEGALARSTDRSARSTDKVGASPSGPFARELTHQEATRLARAVVDRNKSKQPVEVLARIYLAHSQGHSRNHIAVNMLGMQHTTVGRAIQSAHEVAGPHPVA